ncbi:hypothetical protein GCM10010502_63660 [Kitasatospora aureofaciens]|uniref:Uncharacterized protein n=1 Tax=Kitasatospora aureofaciens TaxID=1894 RepID=A0A8H9I3Z6_KITAU|nr:hypothetical protein GCM10010502_63660 [Kitasatospora aureofaciens]
MPLGVVTVTCTVPVPGGAVAVIWVSETTVKDAVMAPNRTAVAPVKAVPVTVTRVPPAAGPEAGETEVTTGVATDRGRAPDEARDGAGWFNRCSFGSGRSLGPTRVAGRGWWGWARVDADPVGGRSTPHRVGGSRAVVVTGRQRPGRPVRCRGRRRR